MARLRANPEDSWMPKRVRRGKSAYECRAKDGRCVRLCDLSATQTEVIFAHAKAMAGDKPTSLLEDGWEDSLYRAAMKSAKTRGKGFDLSSEEFAAIVSRASGKCEVSGIEFSPRKIPGAMRRPWVPSLDRIDSKKPYTAENCRLICAAANVAINEWGDEVFRYLVKSMTKAGFMGAGGTRK